MRRLNMVVAVVLAVFATAGCVEDFGGAGLSQPTPPPFVRSQHLCAAAIPGSADAAAVKQDLGALLGYVPSGVSVKYLKPHDASVARVGALTDGLKNTMSYSHKDGQLLYFTQYSLQVSETGVAASSAVSVGFEDMADSDMRFSDAAFDQTRPHTVDIGGVMMLGFSDRDLAQCVAEEFRLIQQPMRKQQQEQALAAFQAVVDQYRAMPAKPQVPEEQRRFIVQANALTQKKEFAKALALYEQALAVNPYSYPAAHYNMALISAQQGRYTAAITAMKKYLMMVPDAEDARTAQDKIYEWEALGGGQ